MSTLSAGPKMWQRIQVDVTNLGTALDEAAPTGFGLRHRGWQTVAPRDAGGSNNGFVFNAGSRRDVFGRLDPPGPCNTAAFANPPGINCNTPSGGFGSWTERQNGIGGATNNGPSGSDKYIEITGWLLVPTGVGPVSIRARGERNIALYSGDDFNSRELRDARNTTTAAYTFTPPEPLCKCLDGEGIGMHYIAAYAHDSFLNNGFIQIQWDIGAGWAVPPINRLIPAQIGPGDRPLDPVDPCDAFPVATTTRFGWERFPDGALFEDNRTTLLDLSGACSHRITRI